MKFKISKSEWEKIGKQTGWLKATAYAVAEPPKMCEQCGENPALPVEDENGKILGYGDYCKRCDDRMDDGPFSKLLRKVGPEKATEILKDLLNNKQDTPPAYEGDVDSSFEEDDDNLPF